MADTIRVGVILASTRTKRRGEPFAHWIRELLAARPGVEAELIDLRDYPLQDYQYDMPPTFIEKKYENELHRRWSEKIAALDAYVIVTPEYNHGYPGQLKNALDHVQMGWWYKPVGFISYGGLASGTRSVEQLRTVAIELRMVPVRGEVNLRLGNPVFPAGYSADERGWPTDDLFVKRAAGMIDQVLWWARAARAGRALEQPPTA